MRNILFLLFALSFSQVNAQLKLTKIWETKDLATPESVLPLGDLLYVSLIDGDGAKADGVGGIAILKEDGTVLNKEWITGLNAPKGLGYFKGKIYVADLNEVVKIDIKSANVEAKIPINEAIFLNDIAINSKGEVFVSDTRLGKIYRIVNNKAELFLADVKNANGLKFINDQLYVLSGPNLVKIGKNQNQQIISSGLAAGGDGLEPYKKDEFIATCWVGLIYHIKADGTFDMLLDSRAEKINTADIGLNAKKNILYVPTFLKNSVVAYKISDK
ncbi:SMP-30/gluconolactonase/LRE family protein [Pedobacter arcticus]|uniref:hypothetical protein n=1 Tax=Pedobacter arcticus TaxID=752140 RepID=UPI0002F2720C|nr:hypothetical protein [Pedobacter arcticus]